LHITEFQKSDFALGEKNRIIGERWTGMDSDSKEEYNESAKSYPTSITSDPKAVWKETQRLFVNLEDNVCCMIISLLYAYVYSGTQYSCASKSDKF